MTSIDPVDIVNHITMLFRTIGPTTLQTVDGSRQLVQVFIQREKMMNSIKYMRGIVLCLALAGATCLGAAQASPLNMNVLSAQQDKGLHALHIDVAGILNNDERGAASNVVRDFYVGSNATITSFKWDVNVTSHVGSYLSEMKVTFGDTAGNGVTFTPGDGDDFDGTMDYAGFQDLENLGLNFAVGVDGFLRLEFHDGYKDLAFDEPEGIWNFGTLTFGVAEVPEPPSFVLMLGGLLLLSGVARRRRSAASNIAE